MRRNPVILSLQQIGVCDSPSNFVKEDLTMPRDIPWHNKARHSKPATPSPRITKKAKSFSSSPFRFSTFTAFAPMNDSSNSSFKSSFAVPSLGRTMSMASNASEMSDIRAMTLEDEDSSGSTSRITHPVAKPARISLEGIAFRNKLAKNSHTNPLTKHRNPFLRDAEVSTAGETKADLPVRVDYSGASPPRYAVDFEELELVGTGEFSEVFRCRNRLDGVVYAVKRCKQELETAAQVKQALREIHVLAALGRRCPYMISYFNAWIEDNHVYTQTEWCCEGSLDRVMASFTQARSISKMECEGPPVSAFRALRLSLAGEAKCPVDSRDDGVSHRPRQCMPVMSCAKVLHQIGSALGMLHEAGIAHMDVKPQNIFVQRLERNNEGCDEEAMAWLEFRLGDFGQATPTDGSERPREGDARYFAPELYYEDYSDITAADVFALGLVIVEMASGVQMSGESAVVEQLARGDFNPDLSRLPVALASLVLKMISPDPRCRPRAREVAEDPQVMQLCGSRVGLAWANPEICEAVHEVEAALNRQQSENAVLRKQLAVALARCEKLEMESSLLS